MSKRNIRPNSGKQLYLNQIFSRGMLYTSSEMQEGFAKIIDNYDISPTGDAATPRLPIRTSNNSFGNDDYIYPIKFKQIDKYCYIAFNNTISEEEYANDEVHISNDRPDSIKVFTRPDYNFDSISQEIIYTGNNDSEIEDDELQELKANYITNIDNSSFTISSVSLDNGNTISKELTIEKPIYNNELTTKFIIFKPTQTNISLPEDVRMDDSASIESPIVIDGDTFVFNNTKIRLLNIDTPEIGTMWSEYAKTYLEKILAYISSFGIFYYKIIYTGDTSYDRQIAKFKFYIKKKDDSYDEYDVGAILLQLGLASIRYADTSDIDYNKYIECTQYAQNNKLKLYSDVDFDPYYKIKYTNYGDDGDNLTLKDNQYIEVVRINSENDISAKTKFTTDFVNCVYIDYLDAVGFIGRIIDPDEGIIYKGPIFIRALINDEGNELYSILLPTNKGDGKHPDLITAGSTGEYNIFSNEVINLNNNTDENPLTIYGIFPLFNNNDKYEIATQMTTGQTILLKAQITENPYYTSNNMLTSTDNFGFRTKVYLQIYIASHDNDGNIDYSANNEDTINVDLNAIRSINEYSNDTIINFNNKNILSNYLTKLDSTERAIIKKYLKKRYGHNDYEDITWEDIITQNDLTLPQLSNIITLTRQNNDPITVTLTRNPLKAIPDKSNAESLFTDSLLEIVMYREISTGDLKNLYIHFVNNFSNINMTYDSTNQLLVARNNTNVPIKFYQRWYIADANSNSFELLDNEKLIFIKNTSTSTLSKVDIWDPDSFIKPTDLEYTINRSGNIIFKYSIQPKFSNKLGDNCLSSLDIELENTYQEIYRISNTLRLGLTVETVTNESLKQNMDIHNATRINIFNRQIVLYGPYTISNVLFFSKFEVFDYYPFPNNVIEINEPIIWTYNYKDSFIIFGKYNIYMLSGGTTVLDCKLNKIYENLSIKLSDVNLIGTAGNNLIFFNNGEGYIIIPNTYVDNSSNIRIYKLTERISNFFYNPEEYIRLKLKLYNKITKDDNLLFNMNFKLYIQNNEIYIIDNITINNKYTLVTWFIYNQDYKYWRMYSTDIFNNIIANNIFEAPLNNQFVVKYNGLNYIAYFLNTKQEQGYNDSLGSDIENNVPIQTILNSGYLSVDTMNDKRFKDIIIEFDNIIKESKLNIDCEFFIDGSPMVISDTDIMIVNKLTGDSEYETNKIYTDNVSTELINLDCEADPTKTYTRRYGKSFILDTNIYSISGRTHVRIPVFGKGRLPLFILIITSDKYYEFINYALIYKEKNINRRN